MANTSSSPSSPSSLPILNQGMLTFELNQGFETTTQKLAKMLNDGSPDPL